MEGKVKAWHSVQGLDPKEVCRRALTSFDPDSGEYLLTALGQDFRIAPRSTQISCRSQTGRLLLDGPYFFDLCLLWYLIGAQDTPLDGNLITPEQTKGGQIYRKGAHVLPLDALAGRFDRKKEYFFTECNKLGGTEAGMGDAACRLFLFPRLPVNLLLWHGDHDFDASATLLFDASCELHLPPDAIWASAATLIDFLLSDRI